MNSCSTRRAMADPVPDVETYTAVNWCRTILRLLVVSTASRTGDRELKLRALPARRRITV